MTFADITATSCIFRLNRPLHKLIVFKLPRSSGCAWDQFCRVPLRDILIFLDDLPEYFRPYRQLVEPFSAPKPSSPPAQQLPSSPNNNMLAVDSYGLDEDDFISTFGGYTDYAQSWAVHHVHVRWNFTSVILFVIAHVCMYQKITICFAENSRINKINYLYYCSCIIYPRVSVRTTRAYGEHDCLRSGSPIGQSISLSLSLSLSLYCDDQLPITVTRNMENTFSRHTHTHTH